MSDLVLKKNIDTLPKGWINCSIEDIAHVILGQSPPSSTYNESKSGLPFFQGKLDFGVLYPIPRVWCSRPKKIAELDDVLLSVRAPVGSTNLSNQQCCIGRGLSAIRPKIEEMPSKFLLYFFINIKQSLDAKGTGTTFKAISGQQIRSLEISLPPLNEQKRIVAKIEELFSLLESTKEILEKTKILLKQYSQSLLKSAFEGKLVPQDPNDEPDSMLLEKIRRGKDSKSKIDFGMSKLILEKNNGLPKGWILSRMQDIVLTPKNDIVDGPFGSNLKATEYVDDGIPIIRLQNVDRNQFINKNIRYVTKEKAKKLQRHSFLKNDIVITKLGFPVGKATLVPEYLENGIIVADILRMRVLDKFVSRKFLTYLINSEIITKQFANHTQGTTRPRVNLTKFRDFIIPLPPLNEQKRIVAKIEESFFLIHNSEKSVDALFLQNNLLKTSTLKQAFEGKLVPQDPNDEPAEILLEKIKAEKEQLIQKQKASRSTKNVK